MPDNSSADRGDIHSRVTVVERDLGRLNDTMTREFEDVRKESESRHLDLKGMIQGLAATQAERSKIQWPAISVVVGVLGVGPSSTRRSRNARRRWSRRSTTGSPGPSS